VEIMALDPKQRATDRAEKLIEAGPQLGMFGPEGEVLPPATRGPGRPPGAQNKLKSRLRDYLAAKGYRDPAEHLALLAGLDRRDKHPLHVAAEIATVLGVPVTDIAREMRQATEALMPYWHAKLTPDVQVNAPSVNILMQDGSGAVGISLGGGEDPFAPLDVRLGMLPGPEDEASDGDLIEGQGNQGLSVAEGGQSDAASRTDEVTP
jgi:hypothetical protein